MSWKDTPQFEQHECAPEQVWVISLDENREFLTNKSDFIKQNGE